MYTVSQGVFVDGNIADAADFLNEFGAVATGLAVLNSDLREIINQALVQAGKDTDVKLAALEIDGGVL